MLTDRFEPDHPLLFWVLVLVAVLAVLAVITALLGKDTWAGFMAVYSVLAFVTWLIGHLSLLLLKYTSWVARRRNRMTGERMN